MGSSSRILLDVSFDCKSSSWPKFAGLSDNGIFQIFIEIQIIWLVNECLLYLFLICLGCNFLVKTVNCRFCAKSDSLKKPIKKMTEAKNLRNTNSVPCLLKLNCEVDYSHSPCFSLPRNLTVLPKHSNQCVANNERTCQGDGVPNNKPNGNPSSNESNDGRNTPINCARGGVISPNNNQSSGGDGGDDGDGDEKKPFQKGIPADKLGDSENLKEKEEAPEKKNIGEPACEEESMDISPYFAEMNIEELECEEGPMDISPYFAENSSDRNSQQSDCSMPSADSIEPSQLSELKKVTFKERKFEERRILGEGSFGICTLVIDYESGELLALKKIRKSDFQSEEIEIMHKLQGSPYIIHLHGFEEVPKFVHLFMEYAQGGTLHYHLQCHFNEIDVWQKRKLFNDVMEGVFFVHKKSIIHADIKSENILLLSENGGQYRAVISDFGLSVDTTSHEYGSIIGVRGTIRYRSPELCRRPINNTFQADIWACGCVLVEIDSGEPPWKEAAKLGEGSLIFTIGSARWPPIPPDRSEIFASIYEATLALDPAARRTAREICSMMESLHQH